MATQHTPLLGYIPPTATIRSKPQPTITPPLLPLVQDATPVQDEPASKVKEPTIAQKVQDIVYSVAPDGSPALRLFRTATGEPFARLWVDDGRGGHWETHQLAEKGGGVRDWVIWNYKLAHGCAPSPDAVNQVYSGLKAEARFEATVAEVAARIGHHNGKVYLDLVDAQWRVIEIDGNGWRVITDPPIYFTRSAQALPLPLPLPGGTLADLQGYINVRDEQALMMLTGWLIGVFLPVGSFAHLAIYGQKGSAKTSAMRMLRNLIDPNSVTERALPRDEDALIAGARGAAVMTFDNVSHVAEWISDALCTLATGGGIAKRKQYTDIEEVAYSAKRPVIMTGIAEVITRGDLLQRLISIELEAIADDERKAELDLLADYEQARPLLLGALLDAVSTAIRNLPATHFDKLPRLADFARWVEAAAPALGWQPGEYIRGLGEMAAASNDLEIEADQVARALIGWLATQSGRDTEGETILFSGSATDLLTAVEDYASDKWGELPAKGWPGNPRAFSGRVKRIAPALREARQIDCDSRSTNGQRRVTITRRS